MAGHDRGSLSIRNVKLYWARHLRTLREDTNPHDSDQAKARITFAIVRGVLAAILYGEFDFFPPPSLPVCCPSEDDPGLGF